MSARPEYCPDCAHWKAERDKALEHAMKYGPRLAVLLLAAKNMAHASHVIAGTPELIALRAAISEAEPTEDRSAPRHRYIPPEPPENQR